MDTVTENLPSQRGRQRIEPPSLTDQADVGVPDIPGMHGQKMTRGQFLKLSAAAGAGLLLGSCAPAAAPAPKAGELQKTPTAPPEPSTPTADTAKATVTATATAKVPEGRVPGEYSPLIQKYDLQPKVFTKEGIVDRMNAGVVYLKKFYSVLKENPQYDPLLSDYHVNTSDNLPIAIPSNWHLSDLIQSFLNTKIEMKETPESDPDYLSGYLIKQGNAQQVAGKWQQFPVFWGGGRLSDTTWHEPNGFGYTSTDAETAVCMLHEYGHVLQDKWYMDNKINNDTSILGQIADDRSKMLDIVEDQIAASQRIIRQRIQAGLSASDQNSRELIDKVDVEEAQNNSLLYVGLHMLNLMNGKRFPGTRKWDMTSPTDIETVKKRNKGVYIQNYYNLFIRTVSNRKKNTMDPEWLIGISGYEYKK